MLYCTTLLSLALGVAAQQWAGDSIPGTLPTVDGAEVAFFRVDDPTGDNNNLTLINYYGLGSDGKRIDPNNVQRAVIIIHGLLRDPENYFTDTRNALKKATAKDPEINSDSVAILAPYFASGSDKGRGYPWTEGLAPGKGSTSNALVWAGSQWSKGANNQYPTSSTNTSAFYVLDQIVKYFDDKKTFPKLNQIVIAGHSLGAQMVQHYASVGDDLKTRVPLTYYIANPNSFAWLSKARPLNTDPCPNYDDYGAGFSNYDDYGKGGMTYGLPIVKQGVDAIRANFNSRQIAHARALQDHDDKTAEGDCRAYTTGENRHERFFYFIKAFPATCKDPASRNCDTVDFVEAVHDNNQMFGSDAGLARLFIDNFRGDHARAPDFGYPRHQEGDDPFPDPTKSSTPATPALLNKNVYAGGMTYRGCYTNQEPSTPAALEKAQYDDDKGNTIEKCTQACDEAGFKIAGLMNGSQCRCGNSLNRKSAVSVVDSACDRTCPGKKENFCGGGNRVSVFSGGNLIFGIDD